MKSRRRHGGGHGLDLSGTVTSVGTSTVTIKTSTGTTTYKVDANSDIDKNGESTLSKLAFTPMNLRSPWCSACKSGRDR